MPIHKNVQAYYGGITGEHHRYRSWEHCYQYFHGSTPEAIAVDRDHAAIQLGFYLASWGMYRGSGFLLSTPTQSIWGSLTNSLRLGSAFLWKQEFGSSDDDSRLVPIIFEAITAVREAYRPFAPKAEYRQASDTLITKIILGTFGCLPACDRYFINGFKSNGFRYSYLNSNFY